MNDFELQAWSLLIDRYLKGDVAPFIKQLKFIVVHHHLFRGKSLAEIKQQFDTEPEDYFHEICILIIRLDYIGRWGILPEQELNRKIRGLVRNRLIDKTRKCHEKKFTSLKDAKEVADRQPEIQERLEERESLKRYLEFRSSIIKRLNERQVFIFENYRKFGLGNYDVRRLANELALSKQTIELEIRKIKNIRNEEFLIFYPDLRKIERLEK